MSLKKKYSGYKSYSYLDKKYDFDYYETVNDEKRIDTNLIKLTEKEKNKVKKIVKNNPIVSIHDHVGSFPKKVSKTPEYLRTGRMHTAFQGLANSYWDAVFDNMMDGLCMIESSSGWKWTEVLHDIGMRLCDIQKQSFLIHCTSVQDIINAHKNKKLAWIISLEGAAMIENELDRIEQLYGFGVRSLGITYSEANSLGSGLREPNDGGLTVFGRKAVDRMNKVGMLIDCSHAGDDTTLEVIEHSSDPIALSHIGAQSLKGSRRMAPDRVLQRCAEKGGVIGIEAAPGSTVVEGEEGHTIQSVMRHFEYVKDLVGIDHVTFGPDTIYGDHVGVYEIYEQELSLSRSRESSESDKSNDKQSDESIGYVRGLENPTQASKNIVRYLVKNGYSEKNISKVTGGNTLRVLREVWK